MFEPYQKDNITKRSSKHMFYDSISSVHAHNREYFPTGPDMTVLVIGGKEADGKTIGDADMFTFKADLDVSACKAAIPALEFEDYGSESRMSGYRSPLG